MTSEKEDIVSEICEFLANELDDGLVRDDGAIAFTWNGHRYLGFLTVKDANKMVLCSHDRRFNSSKGFPESEQTHVSA